MKSLSYASRRKVKKRISEAVDCRITPAPGMLVCLATALSWLRKREWISTGLAELAVEDAAAFNELGP